MNGVLQIFCLTRIEYYQDIFCFLSYIAVVENLGGQGG